MLASLKLGPKLIAGFLLIALFGGAIGIIGIINIKKIDDADTNLYENETVPISYLLNIAQNFQLARVSDRNLLTAKTDSERADSSDKIMKYLGLIESNSALFEKSINNDEERKLANKGVEEIKPLKIYSPPL